VQDEVNAEDWGVSLHDVLPWVGGAIAVVALVTYLGSLVRVRRQRREFAAHGVATYIGGAVGAY